jgi:hypothetical protein
MIELIKYNFNYGSVVDRLPNLFKFNLRNEQTITIKDLDLKGEEIELKNTKFEDGLIAIIEKESTVYYLHIKKGKIYCTPYLNGNTVGSLEILVETYHNRFEITKTQYSYQVRDTYNNISTELTNELFSVGRKPFVINEENRKEDPNIFIKMQYSDYAIFLEYTNSKKDFAFKTNNLQVITNSNIDFKFTSANTIQLNDGLKQQLIRINDLKKQKNITLNSAFLANLKEPIYLNLNSKLYIINYHNQQLSINTDKEKDLLFKKSNIHVKKSGSYIILNGEISYNASVMPEKLITKNGEFLGDIKWGNNGQFIAKIKIKKLVTLNEIHNTIFTALHNKRLHPLHQTKLFDNNDKVLLTFNYKKHAIILRLNAANNLSIGNLPALKIYKPFHKFKINLAYKLAKTIKLFNKKNNVNLYFEKEASQAVESGKYVFEAASVMKNSNSLNRFVLDKQSAQYKEMKAKWGNKIVDRFSFRNYLFVFLADYFISSELSNHAINARIFNDKLNRKIKATPLYFLQHGITFLKPRGDVNNVGFHKKNMTNNIVKSVVSSNLEASIFNELGYNNFELMKTGMPKFDNANLDPRANKITYMPTWRPWEESMIVNGEIQKTTYYESLMEVINVFEQAGLLNRLQIAAHNKFAQYAKNNFKEYNNLFVEDPTETLKNSIIYITDISSIIFDAINHGAFPIFYWKEFEEIIEKHGGTTPANRENVPGKVADNENELIEIVQNAINTNYQLPENVIENYKKINEFNDKKNTQRVIDELKSDRVL